MSRLQLPGRPESPVADWEGVEAEDPSDRTPLKGSANAPRSIKYRIRPALPSFRLLESPLPWPWRRGSSPVVSKCPLRSCGRRFRPCEPPDARRPRSGRLAPVLAVVDASQGARRRRESCRGRRDTRQCPCCRRESLPRPSVAFPASGCYPSGTRRASLLRNSPGFYL